MAAGLLGAILALALARAVARDQAQVLSSAFPVSLCLRPAAGLRLLPDHRGPDDAWHPLCPSRAIAKPNRRAGVKIRLDRSVIPPKPRSRPDRVSLWRYMALFRRDILSAQPERLYSAWMAEFRTPFFRSYLANDADLLRMILRDRPRDFPKSNRIGEGLRPLLGQSVFLTNGPAWDHQRRIIDPAFERGRLAQSLPAMWEAGQAMVNRLLAQIGEGQPIEVEEIASHAAADVIFRTLFSIPIEDSIAAQVFHEFRAYQRSQPILNLAAFVPLPRWFPRFHRAETKRAAQRIRALITQLVDQRQTEITNGTAPDDLATRIMTTPDPETGT